MTLKEFLRKCFPKPTLQKRYVMLIFACFYLLIDAYLIFYEHPKQQKLIEDAKILSLFLMSDNAIDELDEKDQKNYGESN